MNRTTQAKTTTKTTKKTVKKEVPTETVTPTETVAQTETVEVNSMKQRFENLIKAKSELVLELKREIQELRKMQRDHETVVKAASKKTKKKKSRDENSTRKPSGFASPVVVSDDLYTFLSQFGVKKGDPIARTDVTRHITNYIKEKDLQNPEHRREIIPDAALKKLFGPAIEPKDPNDPKSPLVYTYLKLQRYLSAHFPKKST